MLNNVCLSAINENVEKLLKARFIDQFDKKIFTRYIADILRKNTNRNVKSNCSK